MEINLLDQTEGEFYSCTTWKKDKLPCKTVEFIQALGNRPKSMSYKVCLSQVVPILYNASHMIFALGDLQRLCGAFFKNGFKYEHINKIVCYFLEHNEFLGIKFSLSDLIIGFKENLSILIYLVTGTHFSLGRLKLQRKNYFMVIQRKIAIVISPCN